MACPFEHFYQPAVLSEQGDEFGHGQAGLADDATQRSVLEVGAVQRNGDLAGGIARMDKAAVAT
jgi:hypothetical protein